MDADPTKNIKKSSLFNEVEVKAEKFEYKEREESKIKVLDFKEFIGKQLLKVVMRHSINRFKEAIDAGILISSRKLLKSISNDSDYIKYLLANPDRVPEEIKDGNNYYLIDNGISYTGSQGVIWFIRWVNGKLNLGSTNLNLNGFSAESMPKWKENYRVLSYEES